ncbi:amino-acid N-acetyltransferase subunit Mak10 [Coccidioides posadasii str. Silveira]|uniref:Amino-acid N-acetyltransferase subunit Mak10 n=2 Tax=Coccidioides posadasii (strain RMSCC 757 / Silveira) TaxID=443226 RepID=E9CT86_COCPS|nr:amino-acid N-acetyltransferase subunit Mak10 [Coccidioides posadasii str. Silveira]
MRLSKGPPRITSEEMQTRDITEEFTKATSKTGQLVKDEFFTLFESVGALEMDSGYLAPGDTLDDDYDVMRELLPEEVVGIMDQLLCLEVAWHMGHPLSQTLFTSIYLDLLLWPVPSSLEDAQFHRCSQAGGHEPQSNEGDQGGGGGNGADLVSIVLRAYCLALVKACDRVIARVSSEYYYEEEDFVTQLYNRKLLSNVESSKVHALIEDAISWLNDHNQDMYKPVMEALVSRLVFRREFLNALDLDTSAMQYRSTENFQACLDQIRIIEKSMAIGRPVEESFSRKIQRRLASTVPPRPMVRIDPTDAMAFLKRLCQDAIDVQEILDSRSPYDLQKSVWTLQSRKPQPSVYIRSLTQTFLLNEMRVLGTQSIKQFCYNDLIDLVLPWSTLLDKENEDVEIPSDPRFQIAKHMDIFIKRVAQPFIDTYRASCLNRCRIRRTLCHSIIDWDHLQAETEEIDVHLRNLTSEPAVRINGDELTHAYPLSSWVYHQKLRQVRLLLQLGFELSIYSPEEFAGLYWYLSHICGTHISHLERIRSCVEAEYQRGIVQAGNATQANMAERKRAFERTFKVIHGYLTELLAIDAFAVALHALYTLILRHNLLPSTYLASSKRYSSEKLRYELRMKPFFSVSLPEPLPFEYFEREVTLSGRNDEQVLKMGLAASAEARKVLEQNLAEGPFLGSESTAGKAPQDKKKNLQSSGLEEDWTRDVKDSLRACIATSIAIGSFKKALLASPAPSSTKSEADTIEPVGSSPKRLNLSVEIPESGSKDRWHDWWIVPKVSEVLPVRGV